MNWWQILSYSSQDTGVSQQGIKAEKFAKTPKHVMKARLDFQIGRLCRQRARKPSLKEHITALPFMLLSMHISTLQFSFLAYA